MTIYVVIIIIEVIRNILADSRQKVIFNYGFYHTAFGIIWFDCEILYDVINVRVNGYINFLRFCTVVFIQVLWLNYSFIKQPISVLQVRHDSKIFGHFVLRIKHEAHTRKSFQESQL